MDVSGEDGDLSNLTFEGEREGFVRRGSDVGGRDGKD